MNSMDYLNIGASGFAQVGDNNYQKKAHAENKVLMDFFLENYPIPSELIGICFYSWKSFPHDFGRYYEMVLMFDSDITESWEEKEPKKNEIFWNFFNSLESVDLETNQFMDQIKKEYLSTIDVNKGQHLQIAV